MNLMNTDSNYISGGDCIQLPQTASVFWLYLQDAVSQEQEVHLAARAGSGSAVDDLPVYISGAYS